MIFELCNSVGELGEVFEDANTSLYHLQHYIIYYYSIQQRSVYVLRKLIIFASLTPTDD